MGFNFSAFKLPDHLEREIAYCHTHGEYTALLNTQTGCIEGKCPECQDAIDIAHVQEKRIQHLYRIAGIPKIYADKGLSDYETLNNSQAEGLRQARSFAENFVANPNRSLIFTGNPGTGKTHLSIGIIKQLILLGLHCRYTTVNDMFSDIKSTYNSAVLKTEDEVVEEYIAPAALVIDELGISTLSKTEEGLLYRVINGRYVEGRTTIVVSNLNISSLVAASGDRLIDRLRDGGGRLIDLQHDSYRR